MKRNLYDIGLGIATVWLVAAAFLAVSQIPALAQTIGTTTVDFGPVLTTVLQLLGAVIAGVGAWAVSRLNKYLGIKNDSELAHVMDNALRNGIKFATVRLSGALEGKTKVDLHNEVAALAATYVISSVPGTVAHFKLTPERVRELIEARLPDA